MNFCQFLPSFLKRPIFWGWLIWGLMVIFHIILMENRSDIGPHLWIFTKLFSFTPHILLGVLLLDHFDVFVSVMICVGFWLANWHFLLVDFISGFFMPTSPSNFLGNFLFYHYYPFSYNYPQKGVFLAKNIILIIPQTVVILLYFCDKIDGIGLSPSGYTVVITLKRSNASDPRRVNSLPTYEEALAVESQLNAPPGSSPEVSISLPTNEEALAVESRKNPPSGFSPEVSISLPTYEEALDVEAQLNHGSP